MVDKGCGMTKEELFQRVFTSIKRFWGIDVAALAYEGLLFDYAGNRDEAEKLAALAPQAVDTSVVGNVRYCLLGEDGTTLFIYHAPPFTVAIRGRKSAIAAYLEPMLRVLEGRSIRCSYCGTELDLEIAKCPRCGAEIPFTVVTCPSCGYTWHFRKCPRCGKDIDVVGRKLGRDPTPLIIFTITGGISLAIAALAHAIVIGAVAAAVIVSIGYVLWKRASYVVKG